MPKNGKGGRTSQTSVHGDPLALSGEHALPLGVETLAHEDLLTLRELDSCGTARALVLLTRLAVLPAVVASTLG